MWDLEHWRMVARSICDVARREQVVLEAEDLGTVLHGCREAGWQHTHIEDFVRGLKPVPPAIPPIAGPIRLHGQRAVGDSDKPRLWVGLSRFYLLWAALYDRDRVLRELDRDAATGYGYARVLFQVGNLPGDHYWDGLEVTGQEATYEPAARFLLEAARDRGLAILPTLIGKGGGMDRQSVRLPYVKRVAEILRQYAPVVLTAEMMNEPMVRGDITVDELFELYNAFRDTAPGVLAATGAVWTEPGWMEDDAGFRGDTAFSPRGWTETQGQIGVCHLDRAQPDNAEGVDRPWRQPWDVGLQGRPWIDNEAIGDGSSGATERRAAVLRSHRTVAFISRAFASCFHSSAGVRGQDPMNQDAYEACPKAVRFLPADLANGQQQNARFVYPNRHWTLSDDYVRAVSGQGVIRAYGTLLGGTQWTVPFGILSAFRLSAERNLRVSVYQQGIGQQLGQFDIGVGESHWFGAEYPDLLLKSEEL